MISLVSRETAAENSVLGMAELFSSNIAHQYVFKSAIKNESHKFSKGHQSEKGSAAATPSHLNGSNSCSGAEGQVAMLNLSWFLSCFYKLAHNSDSLGSIFNDKQEIHAKGLGRSWVFVVCFKPVGLVVCSVIWKHSLEFIFKVGFTQKEL